MIQRSSGLLGPFLSVIRVSQFQNAPFCPISASGSNFNPPPNFGGLILKILQVFLWLKFSPSLTLDKIEHFETNSKIFNFLQGKATIFQIHSFLMQRPHPACHSERALSQKIIFFIPLAT